MRRGDGSLKFGCEGGEIELGIREESVWRLAIRIELDHSTLIGSCISERFRPKKDLFKERSSFFT